MGSIADKLNYLNGTKIAIKEAIVAKGVDVADTDTFRSYADKIANISGGGGTAYGAAGNMLLGSTVNGEYQFPTEPLTLDMSGLGNLPTYGLYYKFYNCSPTGNIVVGCSDVDNYGMYRAFARMVSAPISSFSLTFPNLVNLNGKYAFTRGCEEQGITALSFPELTLAGEYALQYVCYNCHNLTTVSIPKLTTLKSNALGYAFAGSGLQTLDIYVSTIQGTSPMLNMCDGCTQLTRVNFYALGTQTIASSYRSSCLTNAFSNCAALVEIHFPTGAESVIQALGGYETKWGATNATIYFDL